jgi:hypothetical protein
MLKNDPSLAYSSFGALSGAAGGNGGFFLLVSYYGGAAYFGASGTGAASFAYSSTSIFFFFSAEIYIGLSSYTDSSNGSYFGGFVGAYSPPKGDEAGGLENGLDSVTGLYLAVDGYLVVPPLPLPLPAPGGPPGGAIFGLKVGLGGPPIGGTPLPLPALSGTLKNLVLPLNSNDSDSVGTYPTS